MKTCVLAHQTDFEGWRAAARAAIRADLEPADILWQVQGDAEAADLFAEDARGADDPARCETFAVPRAFVELAKEVIQHRVPERFALLYRLLWRLRRTHHLLADVSDPDVHEANMLAKAVRRDVHKMHAFVRFKEVEAPGGTVFIAWFEPDNHILEAAAPFFMRRFTGMRWSILTPERSVSWDGDTLTYGPGADKSLVPTEDRLEAHWQTYFAAIFNPARLKIDAMTKEMPKKYWRNMPETQAIPALIKSAGSRMEAMIAAPPTEPPKRVAAAARRAPAMQPVAETGAAPASLDAARVAAAECRRCPLYADATQTVFGEGSDASGLMFVGEQPGDKEDLAGHPFVGPAGRLFDEALGAAAIDRKTVYVTNAVKHFKFEPRGKFRLHKKPGAGEIKACRWWLDLERSFVKPKLVVALGASAAQALLQRTVKIGETRARAMQLEDGTALWITVHPSYILRVDPEIRAQEYARFVSDLEGARALLEAA